MEGRVYAKVFSSLWNGSLVGQSGPQLVFVFLLAHCDREGFVDIHPRVIASLTGLEEEAVRAALMTLEAADPSSRTPESNGVRIERLDEHRDWGWKIVNYLVYRNMIDMDTRRAQWKDSKRRKRMSTNVHTSPPSSTHADVEADGEGEEESKSKALDAFASGESRQHENQTHVSEILKGLGASLSMPKPATFDERRVLAFAEGNNRNTHETFKLARWLWNTGTSSMDALMAVLEEDQRCQPENPYAYFAEGGDARNRIVDLFHAGRAVSDHQAEMRETAAFLGEKR